MDTSLFELTKLENFRKLARRTVETYPDAWKVVHEALQNAKDAIRKSGRGGTIAVELDVSAQTVRVADDGVGFPHDRADLLGFGGTDKDTSGDPGIHGRQGVGLKAVILSTKQFRLESVCGGRHWAATIDDADGMLEGQDPRLQIGEALPAPPGSVTGTTVSYGFRQPLVSDFLREAIEGRLGNVPDALGRTPLDKIRLAVEHYFRSLTYAGDVNALVDGGSAPMPTVRLAILAATGTPVGHLPSELVEELKRGAVTVSFPAKHWDAAEAVNRTRPGVPRPTILSQALPPGGLLGKFNDNFIYAASLTREEQYAALLANPNLRTKIDPAKYRWLFQNLRGLYVVIGAHPVLQKYLIGPPRQFIAANGVPSAHVLSPPSRGGEATYVSNNIHFVVNLKADLNYGKQTIPTPRLVGEASKYFADAVRATLRNVAIAIVGSQVTTTSADDLEGQAVIERDVLARPTLDKGALAFKREPRDENALIAIFFELLGRGVLRDYEFYSLSQKARYDGRARLRLPGKQASEPRSDQELANVEFKLDVNDLVDDFENETKNPADLQLLIVWDDTLRQGINEYEVVDIEHTADAERAMEGVERCLHCKRQARMLQMIVVRDLVAKMDLQRGRPAD